MKYYVYHKQGQQYTLIHICKTRGELTRAIEQTEHPPGTIIITDSPNNIIKTQVTQLGDEL